MIKNKRVVVIGAGSIAKAHIKAFKAQANVDIIGIYSRTKIKAIEIADEFSIQNVENSINALFLLNSDIVVIAVSAESTTEVCQEAFKYPWIILVEKPVGVNYEEAVQLNNLANQYKAKVFVALNRRHFSATRNASEKIDSFNEQRLISVFDQEDPYLQLNSGMNEKLVKNLMYTNSIHIIDYFSIFGRGEITKVTPVIKWDYSNSNFVSTRIDFSSGDIGLYNAVWDAPGPWAVTISTTKIRLQLRPLEVLELQQYGSRKIYTLESNELDQQFKPGFFIQASEVIKASKGEKNNLPTIQEVLKTMKTIKDIYEI